MLPTWEAWDACAGLREPRHEGGWSSLRGLAGPRYHPRPSHSWEHRSGRLWVPREGLPDSTPKAARGVAGQG